MNRYSRQDGRWLRKVLGVQTPVVALVRGALGVGKIRQGVVD